MGAIEIRKRTQGAQQNFVEAPRPRRERLICEWVRDAEDGRLVLRWYFESEPLAPPEEIDYPQAA